MHAHTRPVNNLTRRRSIGRIRSETTTISSRVCNAIRSVARDRAKCSKGVDFAVKRIYSTRKRRAGDAGVVCRVAKLLSRIGNFRTLKNGQRTAVRRSGNLGAGTFGAGKTRKWQSKTIRKVHSSLARKHAFRGPPTGTVWGRRPSLASSPLTRCFAGSSLIRIDGLNPFKNVIYTFACS